MNGIENDNTTDVENVSKIVHTCLQLMLVVLNGLLHSWLSTSGSGKDGVLFSISLAKAHRQALEHMSDLLCFLLSSLSSKCSHQLLDLCSSMLLPASQCLHYQGDEHHAHPLTVFSMLPHLITKPYCRHHSWQNDKTAECKATTM